MAKKYNHKNKAGNLGDVFKHAPLLAAINETLEERKGRKNFKYFDIFTAFPQSPLGSKGEWKQGIGKIRKLPFYGVDEYVSQWHSSISFPERNNPGNYLGSSKLVRELIQKKVSNFEMFVNDYGLKEFTDSEKEFKRFPVSVTNERAQDINLSKADFVFIDPPSIKKGQIYNLEDFKNHLGMLKDDATLLTWFPIIGVSSSRRGGSAKPYSKDCSELLETLKDEKGKTTRIYWGNPSSRGHGCGLFFKGSEKVWKRVGRTIKSLEVLLNDNGKKIVVE